MIHDHGGGRGRRSLVPGPPVQGARMSASRVHTGFVFIGFYWVFEASGFRFLAFKVAVRGFEGACTFEAARAPWKRRVGPWKRRPPGPARGPTVQGAHRVQG